MTQKKELKKLANFFNFKSQPIVVLAKDNDITTTNCYVENKPNFFFVFIEINTFLAF